MFERFTDKARRVLVLAQEEAREQNSPYIGTEHILLGISRCGDVTAEVMSSLGLTYEALSLSVTSRGANPSPGSPPLTPDAKRAIEASLRQALGFGHSYISPAHLLLGLIKIEDPSTTPIFTSLNVSTGDLRQAVEDTLEPPSHPSVPTPVTMATAVDKALAARGNAISLDKAIELAGSDLSLLAQAVRSSGDLRDPAREAFFSLVVLCELAGLNLSRALD